MSEQGENGKRQGSYRGKPSGNGGHRAGGQNRRGSYSGGGRGNGERSYGRGGRGGRGDGKSYGSGSNGPRDGRRSSDGRRDDRRGGSGKGGYGRRDGGQKRSWSSNGPRSRSNDRRNWSDKREEGASSDGKREYRGRDQRTDRNGNARGGSYGKRSDGRGSFHGDRSRSGDRSRNGGRGGRGGARPNGRGGRSFNNDRRDNRGAGKKPYQKRTYRADAHDTRRTGADEAVDAKLTAAQAADEQKSDATFAQTAATDAAAAGQEHEATAEAAEAERTPLPDGQKPWKPNKTRRIKSKRELDNEAVSHLMNENKPAYKGRLDRKRDEFEHPRAHAAAMELAEAAAAEEAAANDDGQALGRPFDFRDRFAKNAASPARLAALYVTGEIRTRHAFAHELIAKNIDTADMSQQDRAFATLLVLGVVSTSGALDNVINRGIRKPSDLSPEVRDALRISTYEIIYLGKQPHAAVDQGVELVRAAAPSASGLGNAVLHRILKMRDEFPFGDPNRDVEALALAYAFPTWMAKRLIEDLGAQAASKLMHASNEEAPLYIGVNSIMAADGEVESIFAEAGSALVPAGSAGVEPAGCYRVENARAIADGRVRQLFAEGKILVSDASAQAIATFVVGDNPDAEVLEVGAGRGTKTILIQNDAKRRFGHQLALTSMDVRDFKAELLAERAKTYGVELADIVRGNAARLNEIMPGRMFDTIFIDAPCSGLGTLRRHPEIRWRMREQHIKELAATGYSLLKSAAGQVKPGGQIIYATCTVTYEENNAIVKRFLESPEGADFTLAPLAGKPCFASMLSAGTPDAHFAARFVRKAESD